MTGSGTQLSKADARSAREGDPGIVRARRLWARDADREIIRPDDGHAFRWARHGFPETGVPVWSYHPEYELHLIRRSEGRYVIGDKVGTFGAGSVFLVGPYLPHDWASHGSRVPERDTIVQFSDEWITASAQTLPELDLVRPRLELSRKGIVFRAGTAEALAAALDGLGEREGLARLAGLVDILDVIARAPDADIESLDASFQDPSGASKRAMTAVDTGLDYIVRNLGGEVRLEQAAALANMTEAAFSRRFKRASGFTFTEVTTRLRISQARRLLDITDLTIAAIAQDVGYVNLSNFNRQFRRATGVTPREYRRSLRAPAGEG